MAAIMEVDEHMNKSFSQVCVCAGGCGGSVGVGWVPLGCVQYLCWVALRVVVRVCCRQLAGALQPVLVPPGTRLPPRLVCAV